ncbi:hypothetical protein F2Q69_00045898 [Brassica cretica]|uniref:Uncharacterized protein n=1 Tax=Brassica cretica TaxID=69181 RepID=A0A8S9NJY0_BRACR|nr:hypothetical protein F2Q69_00045898 [Brassica cretica]
MDNFCTPEQLAASIQQMQQQMQLGLAIKDLNRGSGDGGFRVDDAPVELLRVIISCLKTHFPPKKKI